MTYNVKRKLFEVYINSQVVYGHKSQGIPTMIMFCYYKASFEMNEVFFLIEKGISNTMQHRDCPALVLPQRRQYRPRADIEI